MSEVTERSINCLQLKVIARWRQQKGSQRIGLRLCRCFYPRRRLYRDGCLAWWRMMLLLFVESRFVFGAVWGTRLDSLILGASLAFVLEGKYP